jgi:hypothetical protein
MPKKSWTISSSVASIFDRARKYRAKTTELIILGERVRLYDVSGSTLFLTDYIPELVTALKQAKEIEDQNAKIQEATDANERANTMPTTTPEETAAKTAATTNAAEMLVAANKLPTSSERVAIVNKAEANIDYARDVFIKYFTDNNVDTSNPHAPCDAESARILLSGLKIRFEKIRDKAREVGKNGKDSHEYSVLLSKAIMFSDFIRRLERNPCKVYGEEEPFKMTTTQAELTEDKLTSILRTFVFLVLQGINPVEEEKWKTKFSSFSDVFINLIKNPGLMTEEELREFQASYSTGGLSIPEVVKRVLDSTGADSSANDAALLRSYDDMKGKLREINHLRLNQAIDVHESRSIDFSAFRKIEDLFRVASEQLGNATHTVTVMASAWATVLKHLDDATDKATAADARAAGADATVQAAKAAEKVARDALDAAHTASATERAAAVAAATAAAAALAQAEREKEVALAAARAAREATAALQAVSDKHESDLRQVQGVVREQETRIDNTTRERDALDAVNKDLQTSLARAKASAERRKARADKANAVAASAVAAAAAAAVEHENARAEHERALAEARAASEAAAAQADTKVAAARAAADAELEAASQASSAKNGETSAQHAAELEGAQRAHALQLEAAKKEHDEALAAAQAAATSANQQADMRARSKEQEAAEAAAGARQAQENAEKAAAAAAAATAQLAIVRGQLDEKNRRIEELQGALTAANERARECEETAAQAARNDEAAKAATAAADQRVRQAEEAEAAAKAAAVNMLQRAQGEAQQQAQAAQQQAQAALQQAQAALQQAQSEAATAKQKESETSQQLQAALAELESAKRGVAECEARARQHASEIASKTAGQEDAVKKLRQSLEAQRKLQEQLAESKKDFDASVYLRQVKQLTEERDNAQQKSAESQEAATRLRAEVQRLQAGIRNVSSGLSAASSRRSSVSSEPGSNSARSTYADVVRGQPGPGSVSSVGSVGHHADTMTEARFLGMATMGQKNYLVQHPEFLNKHPQYRRLYEQAVRGQGGGGLNPFMQIYTEIQNLL